MKRTPTPADIERACELRRQGWRLDAIAAEVGMSRTALTRRLVAAGEHVVRPATSLREQCIEAYHRLGSTRAAAEELKVHRSTVTLHLTSVGITPERGSRLTPEQVRETIELREQGLSHLEIATRLGLSSSSVSLRLKTYAPHLKGPLAAPGEDPKPAATDRRSEELAAVVPKAVEMRRQNKPWVEIAGALGFGKDAIRREVLALHPEMRWMDCSFSRGKRTTDGKDGPKVVASEGLRQAEAARARPKVPGRRFKTPFGEIVVRAAPERREVPVHRTSSLVGA